MAGEVGGLTATATTTTTKQQYFNNNNIITTWKALNHAPAVSAAGK